MTGNGRAKGRVAGRTGTSPDRSFPEHRARTTPRVHNRETPGGPPRRAGWRTAPAQTGAMITRPAPVSPGAIALLAVSASTWRLLHGDANSTGTGPPPGSDASPRSGRDGRWRSRTGATSSRRAGLPTGTRPAAASARVAGRVDRAGAGPRQLHRDRLDDPIAGRASRPDPPLGGPDRLPLTSAPGPPPRRLALSTRNRTTISQPWTWPPNGADIDRLGDVLDADSESTSGESAECDLGSATPCREPIPSEDPVWPGHPSVTTRRPRRHRRRGRMGAHRRAAGGVSVLVRPELSPAPSRCRCGPR